SRTPSAVTPTALVLSVIVSVVTPVALLNVATPVAVIPASFKRVPSMVTPEAAVLSVIILVVTPVDSLNVATPDTFKVLIVDVSVTVIFENVSVPSVASFTASIISLVFLATVLKGNQAALLFT